MFSAGMGLGSNQVWCGHGFESHSQPFLLTYPEADLSLWQTSRQKNKCTILTSIPIIASVKTVVI